MEHVPCQDSRSYSTVGTCSSDVQRMPRRTEADPVAKAFGAAVRTRRERRRESLEEVADRIPRMDPSYLGEIELGWHAPTIVTAKRIADALDVKLSTLVHDL